MYNINGNETAETADHGSHESNGHCPAGPGGQMVGRDYSHYLQLDSLLSNVDLLSAKYLPHSVHDEHLFITTHQAFEIWFKEILWELDSVIALFKVPDMFEINCATILHRLNRMTVIWNVLVQQFSILETMAPMDFMRFRHLLAPGSGFQSLQFRLIETKLGLTMEHRVNACVVAKAFKGASQADLEKAASEASLFDLVSNWLERIADSPGFATKYAAAVDRYLADEERACEKECDVERREMLLQCITPQKKTFQILLDIEMYEHEVQEKRRRMSYASFLGAVMIHCYRNRQQFHIPYQILTALVDIDTMMTKWRDAHIMIALRMLGSKGGPYSSGYPYLRSTVSDRYKVFLDLFNVSSFLLPEQYINSSFNNNA